MQATLTQKVQILQALYGYVEGQIEGAKMCVADALTDNDDECGGAEGHTFDAIDVLQTAADFVQSGDTESMLASINGLDTLVREDVYEGLRDCGAWGALQTLTNCYYK